MIKSCLPQNFVKTLCHRLNDTQNNSASYNQGIFKLIKYSSLKARLYYSQKKRTLNCFSLLQQFSSNLGALNHELFTFFTKTNSQCRGNRNPVPSCQKIVKRRKVWLQEEQVIKTCMMTIPLLVKILEKREMYQLEKEAGNRV